MADVSRSAKASSDWSEGDLIGFNIHIVDVPQEAFFNTSDVTSISLPTVPDTILDNVERPEGQLPKDAGLFFQYLKLVESPAISCGSRVNDLTAFILRMLKFDESDRVICQKMEMTFPMKHQHVDVTMDVCVMDEVDIFFVVHECKSTFLADSPEPQIIAQAIAAFYHSNSRRSQSGLPTHAGKFIPAVVMYGTAPVFYRIPVTKVFLDYMVTAMYPPERTVVQRFVPPVPNQKDYQVVGMMSLDNRETILQCFEGIRNIIL